MANTADPRELAKLASSIKADHKSEQIRLIWLNFREGIPSLLLTVFFGSFGFSDEPRRWVYFVAAVLCLSVGLFLVGSSIRQHKIEKQFEDTFRGSIEKSLSQARHRAWMYRNTIWWYFAPLYVGVCIFYAQVVANDPNGAKPGDGIALALTTLLFAGGYWLNRRLSVKKWQTEVERFEALLTDLID